MTKLYIGDGFYDYYVMKNVMYSIATNNSDQRTKEQADYIIKEMAEIEQYLKHVYIYMRSFYAIIVQ